MQKSNKTHPFTITLVKFPSFCKQRNNFYLWRCIYYGNKVYFHMRTAKHVFRLLPHWWRWRDFQSTAGHLSVKYLQFKSAQSAEPRRVCECLIMHYASSIRGLPLPHAWRLVAKTPCGGKTVWADPQRITEDWAHLAKWSRWGISWRSMYKHAQSHPASAPAFIC